MTAAESALRPLLLAEDDADEALLFSRLARSAHIANPIVPALDGEEAIEFLAARLRSRDQPLPTVAVLDVKMPRADGFEVLEWIRRHPDLARLPVFMTSSSVLSRDIEQARELGAQAYFEKYPTPEDFAAAFRAAQDFPGVAIGANYGLPVKGNLLRPATGASMA